MNVQRHERIEQIKKLSVYLRRALSVMACVLWLGWPVVVLLPFLHGSGPLTLGDNLVINYSELTLPYRVLCSAVIAAVLLLTQFSVLYARDLMDHFSAGEIFNREALQTAKKAIHFGMGVVAVDVLFGVAGAVQQQVAGKGVELFDFASIVFGTLFNGFLFFGLMYVLLWAMEIGSDLNDESELTI